MQQRASAPDSFGGILYVNGTDHDKALTVCVGGGELENVTVPSRMAYSRDRPEGLKRNQTPRLYKGD